ncbi:putative RNA 2'-phosphotransferase [Betaproteobacteria bacterium]|nr:putative RNA 2'-phosphotransferase [Betaproteobacteria bacterium]GHU14964.1 putative RNA 2'-phosphotransferase [Betaproteobacteria bacterium]
MNKQHTEISKFLSYVLRHEPHAIGLTLDREGWADIADLIAGAKQSGRKLDETLIRAVVESNDKARFAISEDGQKIRAVQGHSTESVAITYAEKVPPEFLYHGTATRFLESILKEGLKPGKRQHVHLSEDVQIAIAVGQRYGKPVVLKVEALRMYQQGFKFFQADNGVWLTDKVPVIFIGLPDYTCSQNVGNNI